MQDTHITDGYTFSHEVEVDVNKLGALVLNGIDEEVDGADVVTVDECALHQ
jgi:hypothetical protein